MGIVEKYKKNNQSHLRVFWEQQCSGSFWGCRWKRLESISLSRTPGSQGTKNPDDIGDDVD